jgi:hypothetical protein
MVRFEIKQGKSRSVGQPVGIPGRLSGCSDQHRVIAAQPLYKVQPCRPMIGQSFAQHIPVRDVILRLLNRQPLQALYVGVGD